MDNIITSKNNEIVKHIKKLKSKKYRDEYNEFIIEGVKIVEEAIHENAKIKHIVICDECEQNELISKEILYEIAKCNCVYVTKEIFHSISDVTNPQGILAVIEKPDEKEIDYSEDIIVVLDDLQDPGNLGTIDSIGLKQIVVSNGTADVYNPKVVRSTMGAIFRIHIVKPIDLMEKLKEMKKNKFELIATTPKAEKTIYDIDYKKKVIIVGNESNGVEERFMDKADDKVTIPMLGKSESLNASIATGIVLYEYVRQKMKKWEKERKSEKTRAFKSFYGENRQIC